MSESMYGGFFAIDVKPEHRQAFVEASVTEAKGVLAGEPGVYQFHVLVDRSNPCRFYFFEIFRDEEAIEAHWATEVFKTWWNTVEPRFEDGVETLCTMRTIFPSVPELEAQKPGLADG